MKFSIKGFFSKCDQIRSFLRIWSHLLKKSLIENFILCAVKKSIKQKVKAYQINLNLKQFQMLSSTLRYFPRINRRIFMLKYILYLVFVYIQISRKGTISGFHHNFCKMRQKLSLTAKWIIQLLVIRHFKSKRRETLLSANQITDLFYYKYLQKESLDCFARFHKVRKQKRKK